MAFEKILANEDLRGKIVAALAMHIACEESKIDVKLLKPRLSDCELHEEGAIFGGFYEDHQVVIIHKSGVVMVHPWEHDEDCCGFSCDWYNCGTHRPVGDVHMCGCKKYTHEPVSE